jgi:hypothetical protein
MGVSPLLCIFHNEIVFSLPVIKKFWESSLILKGMSPLLIPVNFLSPSPTLQLNSCAYGLFFKPLLSSHLKLVAAGPVKEFYPEFNSCMKVKEKMQGRQ